MKDTPIKQDNVGDTYDASEINSINSESKNAAEDTGQTLSEGDSHQISKSMMNYSGAGTFGIESGTADNYVVNEIAPREAPTALVDGLLVRFRPLNNNIGVSVLNAYGFGNKAVKKPDGTTVLEANDIVAGEDTNAIWDQTNDAWRLVGFVEEATTSRRGIARLATDGEVQSGTGTDTIVTPSALETRTATTGRTGLSELATDAEVQNSTAGNLIVTPTGLNSRTALEGRSGILPLANTNEAKAGTNDSKAMTPKKVHDVNASHQSTVAVWANIYQKGAQSIGDSYNITGFSDAGIGRTLIDFITTPMSNVNYCVVGIGETAGGQRNVPTTSTRTITSLIIESIDAAFANQDSNNLCFAILGDRP